MPRRRLCLCRQALDLGQAVGDRRLALLGPDGDAVGVDELGRDADEAEHAGQISLEMLERRCRGIGVG